MQVNPTPPSTSSSNLHGEEQQDSDLQLSAPGQLRVIKRNGTLVPYTDDKIRIAMTKAFLAVEGSQAASSSRIRQTVDDLTDTISAIFKRRLPSGGTLHIEEIQDQVELALMRSGEQKIARSYVLYREEHARQRQERQATARRQPSAAGHGSPAHCHQRGLRRPGRSRCQPHRAGNPEEPVRRRHPAGRQHRHGDDRPHLG